MKKIYSNEYVYGLAPQLDELPTVIPHFMVFEPTMVFT
jgi:hypothetical protein